MSPTTADPAMLRIATWNLNSLRARLPVVEQFLQRAAPDVLCLQETRTAALSPAATAVFERHGYEVVHVGVNGFNGVAVASRLPIVDRTGSGDTGAEALDREPRLVSTVVDAALDAPVRITSVYVPHGREVGHWHFDYKLQFLAELAERCRGWLTEGHLVVAGDVNVARTDSDVFHPDAFVGITHVTPDERRAWQEVLDTGLVDTDVALHGERARRFTWWNHGIGYSRNLGMRIDAIAVDRSLAERLAATWIDHVGRGEERPSDHAALVADFHREPPSSGILSA